MSRRYWWVNQGQTWGAEMPAGSLWTSRDARGVLPLGRRPILEMRPGDLVFHYYRKQVQAVSAVARDAKETARPDSHPKGDPREPDVGWRVEVEVAQDGLGVPGAQITLHLPHPSATLDKNGQPKRNVYMSEIRHTDAATIMRLARSALPMAESFSGRPVDDLLDFSGPSSGTALAKYRREQAALRARLLRGQSVAECALCGSLLPAELLIAAHIKPRRDCTETERKDFNGVAMLLCALGCDALFEWGYVMVDTKGVVHAGRGRRRHPELARRVQDLVGRRCDRHDASTHRRIDGRVLPSPCRQQLELT